MKKWRINGLCTESQYAEFAPKFFGKFRDRNTDYLLHKELVFPDVLEVYAEVRDTVIDEVKLGVLVKDLGYSLGCW